MGWDDVAPNGNAAEKVARAVAHPEGGHVGREHRIEVILTLLRLLHLAPRPAWRPNTWTGVSVETAQFLWRVDHVRQVPDAVRFISAEPLLGDLGPMDASGTH